MHQSTSSSVRKRRVSPPSVTCLGVAFSKAQDQIQVKLSKLNKIAVSSIDNQEEIKRVDQAKVEVMRGLNEAIRRMEKSQDK